LARNLVLTVNYVGNHGYREPINNGGLNAYGFGSLRATPIDANFGTVSEVGNQGYSNFNGLITQVQHRSKYATLQFNYTYSHSLDLISNGGISGYNYGTASGLLNPQNPFDLNANYGNTDYDVRHNFTTSYIVDVPYYRGPKAIADGWRLAGTIFGRSGVPFSVVDGAVGAVLNGQNYSGGVIAAQVNPHAQGLSSCDRSAATLSGSPCLNAADFVPAGATANFNEQRRNQFRGPIYTNFDLSLYKATKLPWEKANLTVGVQAFNLLNHAPFNSPVNDVSSAQFGRIISNVSTPTSILGAFLGGDSSPRQLQLTARFEF